MTSEPATDTRQFTTVVHPAVDDYRIENLTPETSAALIGLTIADLEALAPEDDRAYIRDALTTARAVRSALNTQSMTAKGEVRPPTREQRAAAILKAAASIRAAETNTARLRASREEALTCRVLGRVDPTTRQRVVPWTSKGVRCCDAAYRALMRAWLDSAPDADVAAAAEYLAAQGAVAPVAPPAKRRGLRK